MFESIINFFKKIGKSEKEQVKSKDAAKERLHLVLMQDRANVSADFLDLMKQEIIEVIKKYIEVDENSIDVRLTNKTNSDGTTGAPALYANIPIKSIKEEIRTGMAREKVVEKDMKESKTTETQKDNIDSKENSKSEEKKDDSEKNEIISDKNVAEVKDETVDKTSNDDKKVESEAEVEVVQEAAEVIKDAEEKVDNKKDVSDSSQEVNNIENVESANSSN